MSEQDNVRAMQQNYETFRQGDLDALMDSFADDAEWIYPAVEGIPYGGSRRGRDQIQEFFVTLANAEEVLSFEQDEYLAHGDKLIVTGTYQARVNSTGRTWETDYVHVIDMAGGKTQRIEIYLDTAAAAAAHS